MMGTKTLHWPIGEFDELENHLKSLILRSISYGRKDGQPPSRSISFNGLDSEHVIKTKSFCSVKIRFRGSLSFNGGGLEKILSSKTPTKTTQNDCNVRSERSRKRRISRVSFDLTPRSNSNLPGTNLNSLSREPQCHRNRAALKLQKVYKSFRTRRQLADCAVLAEQTWWKVLDFAELKRTSISFFDIEKPESATSRWSRARTRAAKVGQGLSKDGNARKLALQHWLEAIDPRHRYGHNLQFYYVRWLHCDSNQPFFYWLDIGQGKEVNLEICPRQKLLQQCIKYLGPVEREAYEVIIEFGRLFYKQSGKPVDTSGNAKWIFVLSTSKNLYVGQKSKGTFQHSSFLAGGATLSAGRLVVEDGFLKAVWPHSGHYLPTEENFQEFRSFLMEHNVDLTDVEECPSEDEDENNAKKIKELCGGNPPGAELPQNNETESFSASAQETSELRNEDSHAEPNPQLPKSRLSRGLKSIKSKSEIPKIDNMSVISGKAKRRPSCCFETRDSFANGYETAEESFIDEELFMVPKSNLFKDDQEAQHENPIPKDKIMRRIDSHKGMKSYQLAYHLATRWTTGAGPRIGCMRDYPPELQFRVLEHANLNPRRRGTPAASPQIPSLSHLQLSG